MKYKILHENKGRIRFHVIQRNPMSMKEADVLEYYLSETPGVTACRVNHRNGHAAVEYSCTKEEFLQALEAFSYDRMKTPDHVFLHSSREEDSRRREKIVGEIAKDVMIGILPAPLQAACSVYGYYRKLNAAS
ncbi:MAG: hypothetical protein Q4B03_06085 [Lachnospiraceae bacterium]|nr:hypothetical protein [Lachnospiraceae bacterium]